MFVTVDREKCVGCNACIRACPVLSVNIAERVKHESVITINPDKCISCGECIKECQHNARTYTDDTERFFEDLSRGQEITLVVAPAFRITEKQADTALSTLKQMGVKGVYDVGFGADICTYMHLKAVEEKMVGKIISQPCAAVTEYILKHKLELVKYLSPVHSPISCMAIFLKKTVGVKGKIACISPCIAKKQEFNETGVVDYNVTFKRLMEYLEKSGRMTSRNGVFTYDSLPAYCGKIYPRPGGLKACLQFKHPELQVTTSEGVHRVYEELDIYAKTADNYKPDVFDVLSCGEGCVEGPATRFDKARLLEYKQVTSQIESGAFKDRAKQTLLSMDKQYKYFDKNLNINDYLRKYNTVNDKQEVPNSKIEEAYNKLLKTTDFERHFDCGACGYKSCEAMAKAMAMGLNNEHNCHQYVGKVAQNEHKRIKETNRQIEENQAVVASAVENIVTEIGVIGTSTETLKMYCNENKTTMQGMIEAVQGVLEQCNRIDEALNGIDLVSKKYQEVTDAILDITTQTHILSINASVEAARAGEAGRAFSVVAEEIRLLADNTKKATDSVTEDDKLIKQHTDNVKGIAIAIVSMLQELTATVDNLKGSMDNVVDTGDKISIEVTEIKNQATSMTSSNRATTRQVEYRENNTLSVQDKY